MKKLFISISGLNCENISQENECNIRRVVVNKKHTCNNFKALENNVTQFSTRSILRHLAHRADIYAK